jgi:2-polyprenyl-6-methoxyphenol hydroxylase-like FAD-dependent oxidoreductase
MDGKKFDAIVVGASIAGCTTAILLGRAGLSVALVEAHHDPQMYKRLCTHYIQASAIPAIRRLGLAEQIESVGGVRNGTEVWTRWGWVRPPPNYHSYGYNVRRSRLDPMLRELAASTPRVELMLGHKVRELLREGNQVTGTRIDFDGARQELHAQLVVGADGRRSTVADLAGHDGKEHAHGRFIYFAYYDGVRLVTGQRSQIWMLEPDLAYAFPNDAGLTLLAVNPAKEKLAEFRNDLETSMRGVLERLPNGPDLTHAHRRSDIVGVIDYPSITRRVAGPRVALVGDAAMVSDYLWGVGCGFAFNSAEWLVDAVAPAIVGHRDLDKALQAYSKRHRRELRGHQYLMTDFSRGRPYNPLERLMFSAAAKDPRMSEHLFDFLERRVGPSKFLAPTALARAAQINLRHRRQPATSTT